MVDLTTTSGDPTVSVQLSTLEIAKIKTEYREATTLPPSTPTRSAAPQSSTEAKPAKPTRRRGPLPKKPEVKKAVIQDARTTKTARNTAPLKAEPPTGLFTASEATKGSIHPQKKSTNASMTGVYTSDGYFSPLDAMDAQSTFSCSVSYNDSSDPLSMEDDFPFEKDFESQRPSSPASSDFKGPTGPGTQPLTNSDPPCGPSLLATGRV